MTLNDIISIGIASAIGIIGLLISFRFYEKYVLGEGCIYDDYPKEKERKLNEIKKMRKQMHILLCIVFLIIISTEVILCIKYLV